MNTQQNKCVIVVDENLTIGHVSNITAVLGAALGKNYPDFIGENIYDNNKNCHKGIVKYPIPILKTTSTKINNMSQLLITETDPEIEVIDFTDIAQKCLHYDEYKTTAIDTDTSSFNYLGILLYGNKKKINKLTGSMALLR